MIYTRYPFVLALISGILLILCFPKAAWGFLAWVALVPLLLAIRHATTLRKALFYTLLTGISFYAFSLHWLTNVITFGWIFVACLETCFFLLFGWAAYEGRKITSPLLRSLWTGTAWAAVEVIRTEIPIFGFGWNLLAYSQSDHLWILQSASIAGAYGLSFLIAVVNGILAEMVLFANESKSISTGVQRRRFLSLLFAATGIAGTLLFHGFQTMRRIDAPTGTLRISLIQGNIPQAVKWAPAAKQQILDTYINLSRSAASERSDLVIWPEASFPGYFNRDPDSDKINDLARSTDTAILLGAPHLDAGDIGYNSAYLVGRDGSPRGRYDKLYLVPFGEYVPLKIIFGWLEPVAQALGVSDFRAGREFRLFRMEKNVLPFAVSICFENIFPNLTRRFAKKGARFLAVITNDAWFGATSAPYQHLQASRFRAVENGIPVVQSANTGVSAFISNRGEVHARIKTHEGKDIFVKGHKTSSIVLNDSETLFSRGGWMTGYILAATFLIVMGRFRLKDAKLKRDLV